MNYKGRIFLESVVARAMYAATDDVSLFLEGRNPGLPMLFEALGEDDMQKLAKQVTDAKNDLNSLKQFLGSDLDSMVNVAKVLKRIEKSFPSPTKIAAMNLLGSKKGIAKRVSQAALAIDSLNAVRASILNAAKLLATELGKLKFVQVTANLPEGNPQKDAFNTERLDKFMEEYATEEDMPSYKDVTKGIKRSYKPAKPAKGWLGKASNLLGVGTPKISSGGFVKDMQSLSFGNIMALGKKAAELASDAASEATGDRGALGSIGDQLGSSTPSTSSTPSGDDKEALGSVGNELIAAVGKNNAQAFVDVVTGKRKLEDLPALQQAVVRAAVSQFEESSDSEGSEPEQIADEVAQAADEAEESAVQFPNIEKLVTLGKERFGDNGDVLIRNFFTDKRVLAAFGVNESRSLESLLFEAEEIEKVEFDELLPIAKEVGEDLEPDVSFEADALANYFDTAIEQDLLPKNVERARQLKAENIYQYTTQTGKNKGKTRKVKVVGSSKKDGYYQAQLQKKDGKFTKDEYALPIKGFGEMVNETVTNRWKILAGVK
jgi:hypothetical protein